MREGSACTGGRAKFFLLVFLGEGGARGWRFLFIVYSQRVPINFPIAPQFDPIYFEHIGVMISLHGNLHRAYLGVIRGLPRLKGYLKAT
jgi:hypothetical protein